jgi:anti-anti-sigma factor
MGQLNEPADDPGINVTIDAEGAATVVRIEGDIDFATSPALRAAVSDVVSRPGPHTVIVDLEAVTFIDSAGIAVLVSIARDERSVVLRKPSSLFVQVLEATGLTDTFPIEG